jgi:signal transduction histidine kinase
MSPIPIPSDDRSLRPHPAPRARSRAADAWTGAAAEREPCVPLADLATLAAFPAWWFGQPAAAIAESLRDLLAGTLAADAVSVELWDPSTGEPALAVAGMLPVDAETPSDGGPPVRLALFSVGVDAGMGNIAVGSRRPDFPTQTERVLLGMAASQAALALQHASLATVGRLAEELLVRASAVRAAAKARGGRTELLATIYVELRAPLDAVAACLERLDADGSLGDGRRAEVGRIRASQRQLQGIAADVLALAHMESGHLHLVPAEVPVDEALAWLEAAVRPRMETKRLRYAGGAGGGVALRADPERLRQVLASLLSGAADRAAPGGSVRLDCTVGEDVVELRVRGDGPVSVEEPFDPDGADAPVEAALGAAVDQALVRAMGGELRTERGADGAAVRTVTLPRARPQRADGDGTGSVPDDAGAATGPDPEPLAGGAA